MYEVEPMGPKRRAFFIGAFVFGLLLMGWADYVRTTRHPAPEWTRDLPMAFMSAIWALYFLLCPVPGMTRNMARAFVAVFTLLCVLNLYLFFF